MERFGVRLLRREFGPSRRKQLEAFMACFVVKFTFNIYTDTEEVSVAFSASIVKQRN